MEQFKLPFPSLQFLASHAIGRCLVLMKVDEAYWHTNAEDSLRECERRVDKLPLPPAPKEYVRYVLRGFFKQVKPWVRYHGKNPGADILVAARGNLDEKRTIRHHFEQRYKDAIYRKDFRPFARVLEHLSGHYPEGCINDFVSICLDLQKVNTFPMGPEYRLVDGKLQVVFRFVNNRSVPPEFNALLEWKIRPITVSMEQEDVLLTYSVYNHHYDEDMFRIHYELLQPSQRLEYVKKVLDWKMQAGSVQQVFCFLNVLDPEMRQESLLSLNEDRFHHTVFRFLEGCLIAEKESFFIPMLKLVGLNLGKLKYFCLFVALVENIHLIGYDNLLFQFWKLLPASKRSEFPDAFYKVTMKRLALANSDLFQVVFDDLSASLTKQQARRLHYVILKE